MTGWFAGVGLAQEARAVVVPTGYWTPVGRVIVSVSRVTAAVPASVQPSTVTPVVRVIEARARTFPRRME